jgi:hypothetical protein
VQKVHSLRETPGFNSRTNLARDRGDRDDSVVAGRLGLDHVAGTLVTYRRPADDDEEGTNGGDPDSPDAPPTGESEDDYMDSLEGKLSKYDATHGGKLDEFERKRDARDSDADEDDEDDGDD